MNYRRIQADIITARNNLSPVNNPTNDEYMIDIAAYHTQQAIEKSLKFLLHNIYGVDDTTRTFKTHNISTLILLLSRYDKDFIQTHQYLVDISDELTNWETGTRYGDDLVAIHEKVVNALNYATKFYEEILQIKEKSEKESEDIDYDI